jgi:hypothetical protein
VTESFHSGEDVGDTTQPIERRRCGLGVRLRFGFQSWAAALPGEMRKEYDMSNQALHVGPAGAFLVPEAPQGAAEPPHPGAELSRSRWPDCGR